MNIISFGSPWFLLLLLLLPLVVWLYKKYWEGKKKVYLKFGSVEVLKKVRVKRKMHLPFILLLLSVFFLILALADPHVPWKEAKKGVNVVLAIDDSGSMSATDYKPSRLEAAKKAAEVLIKSLHKEDYVGIVAFNSGATTISYLTPYKDRAIEKLEELKQSKGATAIGDGLMLAIDMATSIPNKKKVVILLSDGVNNAGVVSPQQAIEYAKKKRIQIFAVGLGSEKPVLLGYDFFGNPQYAQLDEKTLKEIARATGGKYYKSVNEKMLEEIYKNIANNIQREWEEKSIKDVFIWLALLTLLTDIYLVYVRYKIIA